MKNKIFTFCVLSLMLLSLLSCQQRDISRFVPSDAAFAVKIKPSVLLDQSGIQENKDLSRLIREELDAEKAADLILRLLQDPASSGAALSEYALVTVNDDGDALFFLPLKDAEAFAATLRDVDLPLQNGRGSSLYYLGEDSDAYYGLIQKDLAVISSEELSVGDLKELLEDAHNGSLSGLKDFAASSKPMTTWVNYAAADKDLDGLAMVSDFDSKKGAATSQLKFYIEDKLLKQLGLKASDLSSVLKKGSNQFFKYMPENPQWVINGGTGNFRDILELLPKDALEDVDDALDEIGLSRKDLKKVGGDFTLAGTLNDLSFNRYGSLDDVDISFAFALACDRAIYDKILSLVGDGSQEETLHIPFGPGLDLFHTGSAFVVQTSDLYADSKKGVLKRSLASSDIRSQIGKNSLFFDFDTPGIRRVLRSVLRSQDIPDDLSEMLLDDLSQMDYGSIDFNGTTLTSEVKTKRPNEYYLRTITNTLLHYVNYAISQERNAGYSSNWDQLYDYD